MALFTQTNRAISVTTPLGPDVLLLAGYTGHEGLSQLFNFKLDLVADSKAEIAFDKLLGQPVSIEVQLPDEETRAISGICRSFTQGESDVSFTNYHLELVPHFWLLTKKTQSRIFQHITVPDILKKVLESLNVAYEIQGSFQQRDYCVQYRETDFNFACRLMEEEGIYYYFKHTPGGDQLVLANTPSSHIELPTEPMIIYKQLLNDATHDAGIVFQWEKTQELRSGKHLLWDHCFELPHKHLEAEKLITDQVLVGKVPHKIRVGQNTKLEVYDYPGEYAQRFDGVDKGGGDRPAELQKIYEDNRRTVDLRMQQEATQGIQIRGASTCRQMVSGYSFTLLPYPYDPTTRPAKADGKYVLTNVNHVARIGADYRSGDGDGGMQYSNTFTAIPFGLTFRPTRVTAKPVVPGTQTAVVVGPKGEEIFTDKYGRVKVQFHWDREGKNDANSSCWIRVGTSWAGKQWGCMQIPRIGQEVIVDFVEGDPDQPIIVGSVFNAEQMPAYKLPENKTMSYLKSNSTLGGSGHNEFRFEDKKGAEQIFIHAQRNMDVRIENDLMEHVGKDAHSTIVGNQTESVGGNLDVFVGGSLTHHIGGNISVLFGKPKGKNPPPGGNVERVIERSQKENVGIDNYLKVGNNYLVKAGQKVMVEAGSSITLKVGGNFVEVNTGGVFIEGTVVKINCGSSPATVSMGEASDANPANPTPADATPSGSKSCS